MCDSDDMKVKWLFFECISPYEVAELITTWENNRGKMELIESRIIYIESGEYHVFLRLIYDPAVAE